MESLRKQAAKLLGEQRKYKRWLGVFLCLAVLVTAGTVAALTMSGQALSHKQQVLECKLEVHEHTAECYESGIVPQKGTEAASEAEKPICGYADYVVHVHNDDCRDKDGELVCVLPEVKAHEHTEACYEDQPVLLCELEETPGHVHGEECKRLICGLEGTEAGEGQDNAQAAGHVHSEECRTLICGVEEVQGHTHSQECRTLVQGEMICESTEEGHEHNDQCFAWNEELICGLEETEGHTHTEDCYDLEGCGLTEGGEANEQTAEGHVHTESCYAPDACGLEEGAEGHTHGEECYEIQKVVICGQLELHTHVTKEEAAEGAESCYDTEGNLICGIPELKEHVHGEDCFVTVELTKEEVEAAKEAEEAAKSESADSAKTEHTLYQKVYEDELVKVIAEYDETANIPAEAELYVEIVSEADDVQEENAPTQDAQTGTETEKESDSENNAEGTTSSGEDTAGAGEAEDTEEVQSEENTAGEADEPINTTSEQVEIPSAEADTEEQTDSEEEVGAEDNQIKTRGRIEIVPQEVTYKIGFRLDGAEIQPAGEVRVTVWNLEEEESEPQVIVYSAEDHSEQMTFALTRMVEVFVQTEFQKVYEDNSIRVIAEYEKSADIPEEAELRVYEITPESDPERFADCETKFKEAVEDEEAEMTTLLDIGFYLDDTEIEPKDTVTMMVQFLDGEGQPIGESINVVHFAEDKTEVLEESGNAEEGFVVFTTESFSPFAFFRAVGATVGVGLSNANSNKIPLYVLENGEWKELQYENEFLGSFTGVDNNNTYIQYQSNKYKINLIGANAQIPFIVWAIQSRYPDYNPDGWVEEPERHRRIGISYKDGEGNEYIVSAIASYEDWEAFQTKATIWVSEEEIPVNSTVTGIYYLDKNETKINKTLKEFLEGDDSVNYSTVIFNPGNANGIVTHQQYGNETLRTELKIGKAVNKEATVLDSDIASIFLPGDSDLGREFQLFEMGGEADGKNADLKVKIKVSQGSYEDINDNTITVSDHSSAYDNGYRLVGWYDIITKEYWDVSNGSREINLDLKKDHIFYADWVAESYDFYRSQDKENIVKTESTNDFITTRVFDYNELFNIYSANYSREGGGEIWVDSGSFSPLRESSIIFWEGEHKRSNGETYGLLSSASLYKAWNGGDQENLYRRWGGQSGIFDYLFPENDADYLGVHYLGKGDYLFQHIVEGADKVGHYVYDSREYAASYQQSENRFYVYNKAQGAPVDGTGFFPLNNSADISQAASINGKINYFFGMSCEINFYLPADTDSSGGKANQIDGKNMQFSFSGDDDVWVFIEPAKGGEKQLVLDLSGIHGRKEGKIDFSEGKVYTDGATGDISFSKGSYKMTVYYLERGAGGSNCMIDFNIVPQYKIETAIADTMEVTKEWSVPENAKDKAIVPESIELSLYKKANIEKWNHDTGTDERKNELQEKLNLSEEEFKAFINNVQQEINKCSDFTLVETVKVKTNNYEPIKHIWEGLSPYFEYKVTEKGVSSYLSSVTANLSGASYNAWTEDKTLEHEAVIILNHTATKALAYVDGRLTEMPVAVENGVIITPSVKNSNTVVIKQEMPASIIWEVEKSEENYYLKCSAGEVYLGFEGDKESKQLITGSSPYPFTLETEVGNGLSDSTHRIVYKDGEGFIAKENNVNDGTNKETDNLRVRIYTCKPTFSEVHHNTVINTYVPNIVISKIDSETGERIVKEEKKNGFFTLTRTLTDSTTGVQTFEYYYYEGKEWKSISAKDLVSIQNAADKEAEGVFELKDGTLEFKELPDGDYVLTEIIPPDGYELPEGHNPLRIEFQLVNAQIVVPKNTILQTQNGKPYAEVSGGLTLLVRNELPPVYTAKVQFTKYSTNTNLYSQQPLGGAEFKLYRQLTKEEAKDSQQKVEYIPGIESPVTDITEGNINSPSDKDTGIFFSGELSGGTYYLKETVPPNGYNVLTDIVKIDISVDSKTQSVTVNLNDDKVKVVRPGSSDANSYWEIQVFNTQGFELPETGSLGTKPFTIGGAMLITAAAILMYGYSVRRRKSERRSK